MCGIVGGPMRYFGFSKALWLYLKALTMYRQEMFFIIKGYRIIKKFK